MTLTRIWLVLLVLLIVSFLAACVISLIQFIYKIKAIAYISLLRAFWTYSLSPHLNYRVFIR